MAAVTLTISGPGRGRQAEPDAGGTIIGRSEQCDVVLESPDISREHARIFRDPFGRWIIEDLGSSNGIFINGKRIEVCAILPGEPLIVGPFTLSIQHTFADEFEPTEPAHTAANIIVDSFETEIFSDKTAAGKTLSGPSAEWLDQITGDLSELTSLAALYPELCRHLARQPRTVAAVLRLPRKPAPLPKSPDILACHFGDIGDDTIAQETAGRYPSHLTFRVSRHILESVRSAGEALMAKSIYSSDAEITASVLDEHSPRTVICAAIGEPAGAVDLLYLDIPIDKTMPDMLEFVRALCPQIISTRKSLIGTEAKARRSVLDYQLSLAGRIQSRLAPTVAPDLAGAELIVHYKPVIWVGGDCYPYNPATGQGGDMNAESDDIDEDVMSDAWEVQYSDVMNPVNEQDADDDPDGDRYMNFEEFLRGTAPNDPESKPTPLTFYVDNDAPNDPCANNPDFSDPDEDGSSGHPFDGIQEAMDIAISWDTVIVLTGTYTGSGNHDIRYDRRRITLTSTDPDNPAVVAATIIDCEGDPCDLNRGFHFNGSEDANSVLTGFTITNGYRNQSGGIRCQSSSPTISNCTLSNNLAVNRGGGIHNIQGSNPIITNCTFTGNSAGIDGGGVRNSDSSSPTITNCTFSDNSAIERGGGIHNTNSSNPTITNCIFTGNSSENNGGGIYNKNGSNPTVTNCTFTGNNAAAYGGGIYNFDSNPTLKQCILWYNTAQTLAQIYDEGSSATAVTYSDVQSGWPGVGNIDKDTNLTPNLHLKAGSPCIDAGDPAFVVDPCAPYDIDGENRIINGHVDIGADEFLDSDTDGLPDWWELEHFGSATGPSKSLSGAAPGADPDGDGLTNLKEYELFSSDPNADPYYLNFAREWSYFFTKCCYMPFPLGVPVQKKLHARNSLTNKVIQPRC